MFFQWKFISAWHSFQWLCPWGLGRGEVTKQAVSLGRVFYACLIWHCPFLLGSQSACRKHTFSYSSPGPSLLNEATLAVTGGLWLPISELSCQVHFISCELLPLKLNSINKKGLYSIGLFFFSLGSEIWKDNVTGIYLIIQSPPYLVYFLRKPRDERGSEIYRLCTWRGFVVCGFGLPFMKRKLIFSSLQHWSHAWCDFVVVRVNMITGYLILVGDCAYVESVHRSKAFFVGTSIVIKQI